MKTCAFDFETALIAPGLLAPPPVCMSYAEEEPKAGLIEGAKVKEVDATLLNVDDGIGFLTENLGKSLLVGCNVAYDLAVACEERPALIPLVFAAYDKDLIVDIAVRQKLIDIALGEYRQHGKYSLLEITKRMCGISLVKGDNSWRLNYWDLRHVPFSKWPADAIEYSLMDSRATVAVFHNQRQELLDIGRGCILADQYRQSRAAFALHLASCWGLRTDKDAVRKLRLDCETKQKELEQALVNGGLLRSTKRGISRNMRAAQDLMQKAVGWEEAKLTPKGYELKQKGENYKETKYVSVDEEACADSGHKLLEAYAEYSKVGSLLSGHVEAMEKGVDLPIHTRFEVLLETGRTASSNPNVQNVRRARGARECFIPREGWVYVGCDFDRAELHTLAQVCLILFGQSNLADTLNAGIDPHTRLGARLAHTTYEDLKKRIDEEDEVAKEWRQRAKPANFGFPGGMGPNGMRKYAKASYQVILSEHEAEELYRGWQDEFPEVAFKYLGWIRELTNNVEGLGTIEHFISRRWRGRVPYCTAANSFFQGMSADAMKQALWEVTKKCFIEGTPLFGCRVVNEIHDEIIIEAPEDTASAAAWEMQKTMVAAYNTYTKDVPVRSTPVMMNRWSKKAKTIVTEKGELLCYRL